jgi:hypothetical protein
VLLVRKLMPPPDSDAAAIVSRFDVCVHLDELEGLTQRGLLGVAGMSEEKRRQVGAVVVVFAATTQ